jgi:hypothetical protein
MMPPFVQLILMLLYASIIWFLTIYRLFNTDELVLILLPVTLLTQLKDVCLKNYFINKAIAQNHYVKGRLTWDDYLRLHWSNLIFLPYCAFIALENWIIIVDAFFIWIAYLRLD